MRQEPSTGRRSVSRFERAAFVLSTAHWSPSRLAAAAALAVIVPLAAAIAFIPRETLWPQSRYLPDLLRRYEELERLHSPRVAPNGGRGQDEGWPPEDPPIRPQWRRFEPTPLGAPIVIPDQLK